MKKMNVILILFLGLTYGVTNAQVYNAQAGSSVLEWTGKKVTGEHHGTIDLKSGEFTMEQNQIKSGKFSIDMTSIVCLDLEDEEYNKKLVGHLKSDDFFGSEKYPTATFIITSSSKLDNNTYSVNGDLTIKGITHPIEFKVKQTKIDNGVKIEGIATIDRTKYNIRYGSGRFYEKLGDNMIYDDFEVKLSVLASK